MSTADFPDLLTGRDEPEKAGLNQPWRALVALVEVLLAGLAFWGASTCWPNAFATVTTVLDDGRELVSTRMLGNWASAAIGLGTLAALLMMDALRQVVLAVRVRPSGKRFKGADAPTEPTQDQGPS